jgi:hypothetical protein
MDVTGTGRTESAIRAMVAPHAVELDQLPGLAAKAEAIPGGVRLTVTARDTEVRRPWRASGVSASSGCSPSAPTISRTTSPWRAVTRRGTASRSASPA